MDSSDRARTLGVAVLAFGVVGSAVAVGGVDTPVLLALVVGLFSAVAISYWGTQGFTPRRAATVVFVVACSLLVFTAVQTVPFPRAIVGVLSPHAADVWSRSVHPLGEDGPRWIPLSLDPTATRIEVARGAAYLFAFLAALRIARRREGAVWLERTLVGASFVVVVITAVHVTFGVDRLYGFYKPHTGVGTIAPMFNGNHLAGYLNVGLLIGFASLLSDEPIAPRPIVAAIVLLLVASELWIASRGGVLAMLVAMAIVVAWTLSRRQHAGRSYLVPVILALVVVALLAAALFPATIPLLADRDVSKLATPVAVFRKMVPHYPIFGVGRGAFESTYPEFREGRGFTVWTHPENIVAQWASEWGLPVAFAAFGAIAWALRPAVVAVRTTAPVGPWAVLLALFVQNTVDFSSELPAVVIAAAVCCAIVVAGTAQDRVGRMDRWSSRPRVVVGGAAIVAVVSCVLLLTRGGELLDDQEALYAAAQPTGMDRATFRERVRDALLAHPAEPYFTYVAAARAARTRDENVVPWIDHTLERAPVYPLAHLLLARTFRRISPSQARLEYRIYAEQSDGPVLDLVEVGPLISSFEDAHEVAPAGEYGDLFLDALAEALQSSMPATRARIDAELLSRRPNAAGPARRAALDAYLDARDASWCDDRRAACIDEALVAANHVETVAPTSCDGYLLHARVVALRGDAHAAVDVLKRSVGSVTDRVGCQRQLVALAIELGVADEATAAIDELARLPCVAVTRCTENLLAAAELEEGRSNRGRAYLFTRRAHEADPDSEDLSFRAAQRASTAGLHADAARLYSELAKQHPLDARYANLAAQERGRVQATGP